MERRISLVMLSGRNTCPENRKGSPWLDICRKRCCPEFRYGDLRGVESFYWQLAVESCAVYIYTGKRLKDKRSGVVIHFKSTPHKLFQGQCEVRLATNWLFVWHRMKGWCWSFGLKMPGGGFTVKQVGMDFLYASLCNNYLPGQPTKRALLLDAMQEKIRCYAKGWCLGKASWSLSIELMAKRTSETLRTYTAEDEPDKIMRQWLLYCSKR